MNQAHWPNTRANRCFKRLQHIFLWSGGIVGLWLGLSLTSAHASGTEWRQFKRQWPKLWVQKNPCQVFKVIDGDTVHVMCDGQKEKLRLVGIDTPETKHPFKPVEYFGPEASAKAKSLMSKGMDVWLAFGRRPRGGQAPRGKYGRMLAYLFFRDGRMFNALMVREGYAFAMRRYPHVYMRRFVALEDQARNARRGMWADISKVRALEAADTAYRNHKRRCINKIGGGKFDWVLGDSVKKYYFTRRHRSYFRTNPYNRVLFCSVREAEDRGYQAAPFGYGGGRYRRGGRYKKRYSRNNDSQPQDSGSQSQDSVGSGSGPLIVGDTNSQTFRVYRSGEYRVFRSVADAKAAGFKRARSGRKKRGKRGKRGKRSRRKRGGDDGNAPATRPDCGGKDPIVANRRSKKYRVPSMRSYKRALKSKNAVFFCTEREAESAGYSKARR